MTTSKKVFIWVGLGGSLVCCLGVTIPLWTILNGGDNLDRAVADYRRQGLPWTAKELEPDSPVPDVENAAPTLNRAFIMFNSTKFSGEASEAITMVNEGNTAGAEAIVGHYGPELALAKQAAQLPRADFHKDWDLGPEVLFPELSSLKSLVRLLAVRAVVEARRGAVAASNSDLKDAWALSRLTGQGPTLIHLILQIAQRALVLSAVEQATTAYKDKPAALASLKALLTKLTDEPNFQHGIRGEAYMGLVILRNGPVFRSRLTHDIGSDNSPLPPINSRQLRRTGAPNGLIERFTGGKLLKSYVQLDKMAQKDAGNTAQLDADLKAFDVELMKDNGLTAFYRNLILPVYSNVGQAMPEDRARKLTVTALVDAVLQHAQTGHYPAKISDIPGTWLDPFDGKPLRLKAKGESIRIYSVGPDLKDNGGLSRIETSGSTAKYDIVAASPPVVKKKSGTK